MAANGTEGADAPLPLEPEHPLVEAPSEKEGSVKPAEVVGRNWGLERLVDAALLVNDGQMLDSTGRPVSSAARTPPFGLLCGHFPPRRPLRVNLKPARRRRPRA